MTKRQEDERRKNCGRKGVKKKLVINWVPLLVLQH